MSKPSHALTHNRQGKEWRAAETRAVDLGDLRSRANTSRDSLASELEAIGLLLDQGLSTEVKSRLASFMIAARREDSLLAQARCILSTVLEAQGHYRESLDAVAMYETPDARLNLDVETMARLRVRIGFAYTCNGDYPKAIALLNTALRSATERESDSQTGDAYVALARVYRSINEYTIAHDYAQKALEHFRQTGDWRGMAEAYSAIALANFYEGRWEIALNNLEQVLKIVGDHSATHLLGKTYSCMGGCCWYLKRPQEGIRYHEKAISYFEHAEHKLGAAESYNTLGNNFMLIGEWGRAQTALERALTLASELDKRGTHVPMILDSLAQLRLLRGDLEESQQLLERAVAIATENGNKFYLGQVLCTLGRCYIAMNNALGALAQGEQALANAERVGDHQIICESRLLLAEAHFHRGEFEQCTDDLQKLVGELTDAASDLALSGEVQRLYGALAAIQGDVILAAQHFGHSLSVFDLLGDCYRVARARYELGRALAATQPARASDYLTHAVRVFQELGARLDLVRAEEALASLKRPATALRETTESRHEISTLTYLLTLRLADTTASRELLLRELAAVIHQEVVAPHVLVVEPGEENQCRIVVSHGYSNAECARFADVSGKIKNEREREQFESKYDTHIHVLRASSARPATLFFGPRKRVTSSSGATIKPLLRVVELGLEICSLRASMRAERSAQGQETRVSENLIPGFIHASPAMTRLIEEVHKIRSSDVTVLVTGESGTGKELVARAVHTVSTRREKAFVPFNCTAVPKELSDAYLFGYRRGAFTGAVADSPGVIRAAGNGTLFLDEIGDLPLDIQPKLLRFLQEGEIQPLGEQRPVKVDVRIVAATNTDLEEMVAAGRFREDLYYRLNVIRLRVPPLRERRSEIPLIVNHYINHYSTKFGRRDIQISPQTMDLLMVCDWPGNVRQLTNEIQRIVARAEDGILIGPDHLSLELKRTSIAVATSSSVINSISDTAPPEGITLAAARVEFERRLITKVLRRHAGNISRAARELGLTRRGLYLKLEQFKPERPDLKASA